MKSLADKKRSERTLTMGNWVWLKAQPYKQRSMRTHNSEKLSPKFLWAISSRRSDW